MALGGFLCFQRGLVSQLSLVVILEEYGRVLGVAGSLKSIDAYLPYGIFHTVLVKFVDLFLN